MFKKVTSILGALLLTGWMGAANATLIFDFSWNSNNGEIIGEIAGLIYSDDVQSASSITITSINSQLVHIDVMNDVGWNVTTNEFILSDFEMTSYSFISFYKPTAPDDPSAGRLFSFYKDDGLHVVQYDYTLFQSIGSDVAIDYRVSVPEPRSVILLSLGLAGLSFARYRKQY